MVTITFSGSCPAFTPCTSDPTGAWSYTEACLDATNPFPAVGTLCPTASWSNLAGTTVGGITVNATTVRRKFDSTITGRLTVPQTCVLAAGSCSNLETALRNLFTTVACTGTTTCVCDVSRADAVDMIAASTFSGSTLTTDPGTSNARTYEYCVTGSTLRYRETTANADTGRYTLTR